MSMHRYRYETEEFEDRPSRQDLERRGLDGWRLVSILPRSGGSTAYFEKVVPRGDPGESEPPDGPARRQVESFHRQMIKMLQAHGNVPELQRIADGVEHFHHQLVDVLKHRLGDHPELSELADDDARLTEALLALRRVAQNDEGADDSSDD